MTLTDREYQAMREGSLRVMRAIGIQTGGSNVVYLHKGQPTKIGFKVEKDENGKVVKKNRIAKKTGEVID